MHIKFSILIPALTLCALSTYYIYSAPEDSQQVESVDAVQIGTTTITSQPLTVVVPDETESQTEILPQDEIAEDEPLPALGIEIIVPEEPEELENSEDAILDELTPALPDQDVELAIPDEFVDEPADQTDTTATTTSTAQPLDSDIYDLAGSYMSDMGIPVEIAFIDGFYHISLQGMSDSHHTVTERTAPSGNTLDLEITLSSLPLTVYLTRSEEGVLTIAAYLSGGSAPMLSTTATRAG